MDVVVERCAGLDVHKDTVVACVRTPETGGSREQTTRTFKTMTIDLMGLRDWLVAMGVTLVGMESTGVYWKPVFYVLEDEIECWLLNARHLRNVPGRKTDVQEAEWICQLVEPAVRPSFVPPKPIRELRDLTRYRKAQIDERGREAQRLDRCSRRGHQAVLGGHRHFGQVRARHADGAGSGTRDPQVLGELARGRLRTKIPLLRRALEGRFVSHHRLIVERSWPSPTLWTTRSRPLGAEIGRLLASFAARSTCGPPAPGSTGAPRSASSAEIGVDMARFGRRPALASWAGRCPGHTNPPAYIDPADRARALRPAPPWPNAPKPPGAPRAPTRAANSSGHADDAVIMARKAVEHSILAAADHVLDRLSHARISVPTGSRAAAPSACPPPRPTARGTRSPVTSDPSHKPPEPTQQRNSRMRGPTPHPSFRVPKSPTCSGQPPVPPGDASRAGKMGWVACRPRPCLGRRARGSAWRRGPTWTGHALLLRHADQNFGSLDRGPQAIHR